MNRPLTPDQTKSVFAQKVHQTRTPDLSDDTIAKLRGAAVGHLQKLFGDERRIIVKYLFAKDSSKDLTYSEIVALLDWMGFKCAGRDIDGKRSYIETDGTAYCREEGANIIRQYLIDNGQSVMF
jgi:hypothetical protein